MWFRKVHQAGAMSAPSRLQATADGSCYQHAGGKDFARRISTVVRKRAYDLFIPKQLPADGFAMPTTITGPLRSNLVVYKNLNHRLTTGLSLVSALSSG
jgi:hypothetical protein